MGDNFHQLWVSLKEFIFTKTIMIKITTFSIYTVNKSLTQQKYKTFASDKIDENFLLAQDSVYSIYYANFMLNNAKTCNDNCMHAGLACLPCLYNLEHRY